MIKLKVGANLDDDVRRLRLAREAVGPDIRIAVDANQVVGRASRRSPGSGGLAPFDPYWIEEPTSPDDILGHAAIRAAVRPIKVATGEHAHNQVMFKQLLQAGALDVLQMDASRVAGVNENVAILLLAAKFGVPVCPHAGGRGAVRDGPAPRHVRLRGGARAPARTASSSTSTTCTSTSPIRYASAGGRYLAPTAPGLSAELQPESVIAHHLSRRRRVESEGAGMTPKAVGMGARVSVPAPDRLSCTRTSS